MDKYQEAKRRIRSDTGDYPEDVHYAYTVAGNAYHAICDLSEIDKQKGLQVYNDYSGTLDKFIEYMENCSKLAEKLMTEECSDE